MDDIFKQANGLISENLIRSLFPDPQGYTEGDEYYICSPLRPDNTPGTFSINLNNGYYNDFASDDKGDLIDLVSQTQNIKKLDAAKKIIESAGHIPEIKKTKKKKKKPDPEYPIKNKELANRELIKKKKDPYIVKKWGEVVNTWIWRTESGDGAWAVFRHLKDGKKQDVPYYFGTDGKFWPGLPKKENRPLYNSHLITDETKNILIVEGQKCAAISVPGWVLVTWSGGTNSAKKNNWDTIKKSSADQVVIWPDNDSPGIAAAVEISTILNGKNAEILNIPGDKPKKWDIADAIDEGVDPVKFIEQNRPQSNDDVPSDFENLPFKFLGFTDRHHYFLPETAPIPLSFPRGSISGGAMIELAREAFWATEFPNRGSFDKSAALDWIVSESHAAGHYDPQIVRGAGVWRDENRIIVNTGKNLVTHNGREYEYKEFSSDYIYTLSGKKFGSLTGEKSTDMEGMQLVDLFRVQQFRDDLQSIAACGWALIAPFSSFLRWRPHIWITGQKSIGKSFLLEDIITPLVGSIAHVGSGKDTEAGIRRSIRQDGCPVILDEMEPQSQDAQRKMDGIIELARNASNDASGTITISGSGGGVDVYKLRQSFLFSSIVPYLQSQAVKSRFVICTLSNEIDKEIKIKKTKEILKNKIMLDPARYRRRIFSRLPEIEKNIKFLEQWITELTGQRRTADVFAPLIAAVFSVAYEGEIESNKYFQQKIVGLFMSSEREEDADDENQLLNEIFESIIKVDGEDKTIGSLLSKNLSFMGTEANPHLLTYGIRVMDHKIAIAINHKQIKSLLKDTFYQARYSEILKRHPYADQKTKTINIGGTNMRAVFFDRKKIKEEFFNEKESEDPNSSKWEEDPSIPF